MLDPHLIKHLARRTGFDLCGVAPCRHLTQNEPRFRRWIEQGSHASLDYLTRHLDKRFDPRRLVEGAQSVVVCAVSYKNALSDGYPERWPLKIASYALCTDYHTTLRGMLRTLFEALRTAYPALQGRAFVDTAPLLEKQLAVEAGLGWIGRQSLLVTPQLGSFVLLGELVLTLPCAAYDTPYAGPGCGSCRRCAEACPNGAVGPDRMIDANRCIACHTIERQPAHEAALDGWIFGCDACQSRCPYNRRAPQHTLAVFDPHFDPRTLTPDEWLAMTPDEFRRRFGDTPLMRSGLERIQISVRRNLAGK